MDNPLIVSGRALTRDQFKQINEASLREFHTTLSSKGELTNRVFFLLIDNSRILAMGQLLPIKPVLFNSEIFSLLGIGGVIANEKGKGYGKQIITAISGYLSSYDKTGLGFCMPKNQGFYEKLGLKVDQTSTQRFVYRSGSEKITDKEGQYIIYQDSSDRFMERVLVNPGKEVSIPMPPTW